MASRDPWLLEEQLEELLGGTGLLAALLIIKQVGHHALRDTLKLTGWDQPPPESFFKALTETTAEHATDAATRYVANIAPLVVSAANKPYFQDALIAARMSEIRTPEGRTTTLSLLAELVNAAGRFAGRFTTPVPVADLMLELVAPRPGETIYDPCFGFGGFLLGAARRISATTGTDPSPTRADRGRIVGVEVDREAYAVGLCRTLLAGIQHARLELGDALHRP
ncbi:MAG: N-6 DNA methylase, partial [Acidobacteriota bacterium]|nr:N-6 DNA methylase [Acidobacteriota bacterium]